MESKLDDLSSYLKQEEIEKTTPITRLQREMNLALNLSKNLDFTGSFVYSPVTIILGIYPFFKLANPRIQQKMVDFFIKNGTDENAKEYFIDLLSVFKATRPAIEMLKPYAPNATEIDEYCHRYGRHGLELSVIEDFLKMDISFLELQTESEDSHSLINSFDYDPFYGWFINWFHTKEKKFYTSPEESRDLEFMCLNGYKHNYSENEQFRMVEIKIKTFTSLYVFLPKEQFKLKEIMKNMEDTKQFYQLMNSSKQTYISFTDKKYKDKDEDYIGFPELGVPFERSPLAIVSRFSKENLLKEFVADHSFVFVLEKDLHVVYFGCYN
ncbi:hypothetical protein B9Z55_015154 [Caenorhabditis nigoni]|uniref:Serpin domain-containing protein n=1 Tax=Caenorhabditis nigoni TaxID=1611254 RepID=A0A2G5U8X7_9PELO|nr:hypothetical protein B9Z55_015154 [Caenorhabditis nigoni]